MPVGLRNLPPLFRAAQGASDLTLPQRWAMVAGILVMHLGAAWGLMQVSAVREAVQQAVPIFVNLIGPSLVVPTPPLAAPRPPAPRTQTLVQAKPQSPAPLIAATPGLVPALSPMPIAPSEPAVVSLEPATLPSAPRVMDEPPPPKIIPASAVQYLEHPVVNYPHLSKRNGETGLVIVRGFIDAAGGVPRQVQISQSSGHVRLDEAAVAAVKLARFKPYTENGQPVAGWALIPIHFELEK